MNMRTPVTGRVGVGLVLFGGAVLAFSLPRLVPRPLVVLDMPVSLSPGRITTGTFTANPDILFYIDIETDKQFRIPPDCEPRYVLKTRFVLSGDEGQLTVQGSSPWEDTGLTIADFIGATRYAFDAEILPGASCLNAGNPRLKVRTHPAPDEKYLVLCWLAVVSAGVGLVLLIRSFSGALFNKNATPFILGAGGIELHPIARRPLPRMSLPAAPLAGVLYSQISLLFLICGLSLFGSTWASYQPSTGLFVVAHLSSEMKSRTCAEIWVVRIDKQGTWYLNSARTSPQELVGSLRRQLAGQTNCAVYLDVDPSLNYEAAVHAIDAVQATQAKFVVLSTPQRTQLDSTVKRSAKVSNEAVPVRVH